MSNSSNVIQQGLNEEIEYQGKPKSNKEKKG
jgi:hypothetical protein